MHAQLKHKVLAYITRVRAGRDQLLVFEHRDFPDAGLQIPAGTVEDGESTESALFREIKEESGLRNLLLVGKLGEADTPDGNVIRHVFHLTATEGLPDSWDWVTNDYHDEGHRTRNEPLVFRYRWTDLREPIGLAGGQDAWIHRIGMAPPLLDFLRTLTPGHHELASWADGTMPLRIASYLCNELPPLEYVSSVRSIVHRDDSILVCRNADSLHVLPGGRREAGETLSETLVREVLEETGWRVAPQRLLGLMQFQHLAPRPEGYRHPHPHFIMIVYVSQAVEPVPGARLKDDYEVEADFRPIASQPELELDAASRFFLGALRRGISG